ncbi:enoyl-ACP reductase FabV [Pinirhizobacter soli]|uniref:enoyl-ACP reductase FabV n=1 Tax=Pinirhizobacter soli TaxID=2786953 RepID=UPI00202A99B8
MVINPKVRGFICTTAHPVGCEKNVIDQIEATRIQGVRADGPKRVLVIGASTGYGLASRITAAFGFGAATLGVFFEKPATESKTGTAGWYNSAAFERLAHEAGLWAKSINGDAFSNEARARAIEIIKAEMGGEVDLVVYSLASPVRKLPDTGELVRSALKPIGESYQATSIDTNKDAIIKVAVEPATEQEVKDTVTVMGGEDWALWMDALASAGVLAKNARTVAYSYIGTQITWPIYWHGSIGQAKQHLDDTAHQLTRRFSDHGVVAQVAVMKSVVTQASAAIPVIPLYVSLVFKIMKEKRLHEGTIEQTNRLFRERLYRTDGAVPDVDEEGRLRLDDWELRDDVQSECTAQWDGVTTENLFDTTDYRGYKIGFLHLFGFARPDVNYEADVKPNPEFDCIEL